MKKDEYRRWFSDKLQGQNRLLVGAITAMVVLGLFATLFEVGIFAAILCVGFVDSRIIAFIVAFGIFGGILFFTFLRLLEQLADSEHEIELDGSVTEIRVAPTMTAVWTYALGSLETDQTWVERLLGKLALPQRLLSAAFFLWQRMEQLKTVDVDNCSAVIRLLHKAAERVEASKLVEELKLSNPATTLRNVSLIDGVMFLTRKSLGLSLSNRLVENLDEWAKTHRAVD